MRLSKNFTLSELTRSSTAKRKGIKNEPTEAHKKNLQRIVTDILQPMRDQLGPIRVTSGYRSPKLNRSIGGSTKSQHCKGQAVGDKGTEMMFPQEYKKYSAEVRRISRRSPKEIAAVIRGKEGEMNPDDFKRYNNFLLYYIALNSEATFNNVLIELDINTVE